jgi:hypothetical protein
MFASLASLALGCAAPDENTAVGESTEAATLAVQSRPNSVVLNFSYQIQQTTYWCGPTATRAVLSARTSSPPTQSLVASELGTTTNGTDSIDQVTRVLNNHIGNYKSVWLPNDPPTAAQKSAFWTDIVRSIDAGYGIVANIVAPASNHPPGYPDYTIYHYIAVMGYNADTSEVFIADSADFQGYQQYWLTFNQLATLVPPKGYSAWFPKGTTCPNGKGTVIGAIEQKYLSLGGCSSFLGAPLTEETMTPDTKGRYTVFEGGSIYWTQDTGAHEVHGTIRDAWKNIGWETSVLAYPTSDELATTTGTGKKNLFQGGAIYWSAATGAHEIYGDIRQKWISLGEEKSSLGLPTSGEYAVTGGRRNDFEHGSITWNASSRATTVTSK